MVQPDRPQMTIWRMGIACWVTKATETHSEYEILVAFQWQQWVMLTSLNATYIRKPALFSVPKFQRLKCL